METRRVGEGYSDAFFSLAYASGFQNSATSRLTRRACIGRLSCGHDSLSDVATNRDFHSQFMGRHGSGLECKFCFLGGIGVGDLNMIGFVLEPSSGFE